MLDLRKISDLAAFDASQRARAGEQRSEQIARELDPTLSAVRSHAEDLRRAVEDPSVKAVLDALGREVSRAADLVRGVLVVADSADNPDARGDLCDAVRRVMRQVLERGAGRGANVTLDLDERPCMVPGTPEALDRLALALISNAIAAGGDTPLVGVFVRRMPRRQLEDGSVRRADDPGLTIVPRRANPRLDRWLRDRNPPSEVVKFIVADSGAGIPADVEKRFYDPRHESDPNTIALAIGRRVVDQSLGTVWVQRAREGGAAFHVVLPVVNPGPPAATPSRNTPMALAGIS
jgi:signal transduction histidine kinase